MNETSVRSTCGSVKGSVTGPDITKPVVVLRVSSIDQENLAKLEAVYTVIMVKFNPSDLVYLPCS